MDEKIDTLLKEGRVIQPTAKTKAAAHIQDYEQAYQASIADPEAFWGGVAKDALGQPIHDSWWQTETGGIMIANSSAEV